MFKESETTEFKKSTAEVSARGGSASGGKAGVVSIVAILKMTLAESEIKVLVVDDKWIAALEQAINGEMDRISQRLTGRIKELAGRYATPLPVLVTETETLPQEVNEHLAKMGYKI